MASCVQDSHDVTIRQGMAPVNAARRLRAVEADAVGLRVVGCLIEKQRTTPDVYPLSVNALRAACNQTTNRDPVVSYDEPTIRDGARPAVAPAAGCGSRAARAAARRSTATCSTRRSGSRGAEISLLAVLMLRGPQTPGELNQRTDRLYRFSGLAEVEETLEAMAARELVARQPRRPGQKEDRYAHLLGGGGARAGRGARRSPASRRRSRRPGPRTTTALARLERELSEIRDEVAGLRASLRELRDSLGS